MPRPRSVVNHRIDTRLLWCILDWMGIGFTLTPKWRIGLDGLSECRRSVIQTCMKTIELPRGSSLFAQGEPSSQLFVVERGRIKISQTSEYGDEFILGICSGGSTVGLSTVILDLPHNVSATTVDKARVSAISRTTLVELMQMLPPFGLNLARLLATIVVESFGQRADMARSPAQIRLSTTIMSLAQQRSSVENPRRAELAGITHEDLAKLVGVGRPWISMNLSFLEERGLISKQRRRIVINDVEQFSSFISAGKGASDLLVGRRPPNN